MNGYASRVSDYEHDDYHNVMVSPAYQNNDYHQKLWRDSSLDYVKRNERNSGMMIA